MIMKHKIVAAAVALAGVALAPNAYAAGSVSASYFTLTSIEPGYRRQITDVDDSVSYRRRWALTGCRSNPRPELSRTSTRPESCSGGRRTRVFVLAGTKFAYPTHPTLPFDISSNFFPNGPGPEAMAATWGSHRQSCRARLLRPPGAA